MSEGADQAELGIHNKDDHWLNEECVCGHIRYLHRPGREEGTLGCTRCPCEKFEVNTNRR